jgi:hypothetical protein
MEFASWIRQQFRSDRPYRAYPQPLLGGMPADVVEYVPPFTYEKRGFIFTPDGVPNP